MKKYIISFILIAILLINCYALIFRDKKNSPPPILTAFLGDSITWYGFHNKNGYVNLAVKNLKEKGFNIIPISAGICGDTTYKMLARIDKDVISKKPNIMFFMGGINDAAREIDNTKFEENVKQIINKAKAANIEVVILNITLLTENPEHRRNKKIDEYNKILKKLAKDNSILYIDVNSELKKELNKELNGHDKIDNLIITVDGGHLNKNGNLIVANKLVHDFTEYKNKN